MALDPSARDMARRRDARRTFGPHLTTYLFVNLLLFIVDAQSPGGWWFFWPLIGWGIGVANHAWQAFGGGDDGLPAIEPPALGPSATEPPATDGPRDAVRQDARGVPVMAGGDEVPDREC